MPYRTNAIAIPAAPRQGEGCRRCGLSRAGAERCRCVARRGAIGALAAVELAGGALIAVALAPAGALGWALAISLGALVGFWGVVIGVRAAVRRIDRAAPRPLVEAAPPARPRRPRRAGPADAAAYFIARSAGRKS